MSFNEGLLLRAVIGNVSFGILLFLTLALSRPLWNLFEKLKWLPSARKSQDFMNVQDKEIKAIMSSYSKYCVYGLSNDPEKASHYVPLYMRDHKWDMVGIYPKSHTVNNFKIYDSLKNVPPDYRKMVNVFRSSDRIPEVVDEILEVGGVEVLWLQLGISNPEAEARAEKAGLKVISNRCLIIEHKRWF